ncbi:MAG: NAD(P)-dependent alcohol dehydrogenase, partial [Acidobacteria bacterium]|nr:NAD(P)-dependent alcohol dehydrogenase [Acidobacteriota bacterium]
MKGITYRQYGSPDILRYEEIERPAPKENEVLVRVRAAAVNPLDWHFMTGTPYDFRMMLGPSGPKITR